MVCGQPSWTSPDWLSRRSLMGRYQAGKSVVSARSRQWFEFRFDHLDWSSSMNSETNGKKANFWRIIVERNWSRSPSPFITRISRRNIPLLRCRASNTNLRMMATERSYERLPSSSCECESGPYDLLLASKTNITQIRTPWFCRSRLSPWYPYQARYCLG